MKGDCVFIDKVGKTNHHEGLCDTYKERTLSEAIYDSYALSYSVLPLYSPSSARVAQYLIFGFKSISFFSCSQHYLSFNFQG